NRSSVGVGTATPSGGATADSSSSRSGSRPSSRSMCARAGPTPCWHWRPGEEDEVHGTLDPKEDAMTIAIVGVGETDYQWADPRPVAALALDATRRALDDAGLSGQDVDGFVIEAMTMGEQAPADEIAQRLGVRNRGFSTSLGIAGSGTVGAPIMAQLAIE